MKPFLLLVAAFCVTVNVSSAQDLMSDIKSAVTKEASNISLPSTTSVADLGEFSGVKDDIMGKLGSSLSLTDQQMPKVSDAVTTFLQKKAAIMPLLATNKSAYKTKFATLKSGLLSNIKSDITKTQYTKFLKLKPSTANAKNVLSNLFY